MTTPTIVWQDAKLPLVTLPERSLKDPALMWHAGWFHLVCSVFDADNHSQLMTWKSRDLANWEGPLWSIGDGADGWCSPDIISTDAGYIMTFQSWDAIPPRESKNQLYYATSSDGENWSDPIHLAGNLTAGVRAIDAAVAQHADKWYLLYKEAQTPRLAIAPAIDGPWELLTDPLKVWAENGQFLKIDGNWHLLATILNHEQGLASLSGDPDKVDSWSQWSDFTTLATPVRPGFNESSAANASALWDGRWVDGYWYRVFCAAQQPTDNNWGYELGIARSTDLKHWELPGNPD